MSAAATHRVREDGGEENLAKSNGHDAEVLKFSPEKELSLMAKASAKSAETIQVTKGFLLLVGLVPVFLSLLFQYGGSLIGWARQDQAKEENIKAVQKDVEAMREDVNDMKGKFEKLQDGLNAQQLRDAEKKGEVRGYQLRDAEDESHGKK